VLHSMTFNVEAESDDSQVEMLVLIKWHVSAIVDGMDYGKTMTLYAKRVMAGIVKVTETLLASNPLADEEQKGVERNDLS
jgi:hypothetical protein